MLEHARADTSNVLRRDDDELRTGLRGHITALMPQEVILPRRGLTSTTSKVLRASLRNPRQHQLTPGDRFWDAERTMEEVTKAAYFKPTSTEQAGLPQALQVSFLHCIPVPCDAKIHIYIGVHHGYRSLAASYLAMPRVSADAGLACLGLSVLHAYWLDPHWLAAAVQMLLSVLYAGLL